MFLIDNHSSNSDDQDDINETINNMYEDNFNYTDNEDLQHYQTHCYGCEPYWENIDLELADHFSEKFMNYSCRNCGINQKKCCNQLSVIQCYYCFYDSEYCTIRQPYYYHLHYCAVCI